MLLTRKVKEFNRNNFRDRMNALFLLFISMLISPTFLPAQPVSSAAAAVRNAEDFEKISRVSVPERPFLFLNKKEIEAAFDGLRG